MQLHATRIGMSVAAAVLWTLVPTGEAVAQARIEAEAVAGEPFGVGRITVELPERLLPVPLGIDGLGLGDKDGRVLYPAIRGALLGPVVKDILGADSPLTSGGPVRQQVGGLVRGLLADRPPRATVFFLFRGDSPLALVLQARTPFPLQVVPRHNAALHGQWLDAWWREYSAPPPLLLVRKKADYPPLLENYLATTLARRLNLRLPEEKQEASAYARLEHEAGVMLETESILLALEQNRILGMTNFALPADQPLPGPVDPPPLAVPEPDANVKIEPIAMHVPAECFYVRFGSFSNFLWMQDTMDTWGGDLQNLVARRGLDYGRDERMQDQLILRQTELSRLLGDTVISDVAIVGSDMFFREGAAYGFLFEARNNLLLASDLSSERSDRLARGGVTEQKLTLAGREVSLIASPDGSVRSYYAQSGDYHFVTSSRALAERFLQVAQGPGSLGASKEFRHARTVMPLARDDTVFVYLSDAFFRNVTGPHYRVETMRRLEAVADVELVQLAQLASRAEGRHDAAIEQLIAGGLLPDSFGPRPDGSRAVLSRGEVQDQLRGRRGQMTPVPDVPLQRITAAEAASYAKFAEYYRSKWGRLDPVTIALRRQSLPDKRDRIVLDVRMTPLDRRHFDFFAQWFGPADKVRLAAVPGDMAALELILRDQRLFGGLRDVGAPRDIMAGPGTVWERLRNVLIGYVGSYGPPGLLAVLDATIPGPPDAAGYSSNCARTVAAAVRPLQRLFLPAGNPDHGHAATPLRECAAGGPSLAPRRRPRASPGDAVAEPLGLRPHPRDLAGESPPAARLGAADARPRGRLPEGGRIALGGATDLPAGRRLCVAHDARRTKPLDLDGPGSRGRRRLRDSAVGRDARGAAGRTAAAELVPRPGHGRHDDPGSALRPRGDPHATAGEEIVPVPTVVKETGTNRGLTQMNTDKNKLNQVRSSAFICGSLP